MEKQDRSFTVDALYQSDKHLKTSGGRYISTTPANAAKKAFSQYCRRHNKIRRFSLIIYLRETTNGSSHKIYKYKVSKVGEENEIKRGGETIMYSYKIQIKSI